MIQKSNGFNPFLTDMNYKITFKTWLKFARQRIRMESSGSFEQMKRMSFKEKLQDAMIKTIDVEIEVQNEIEWTSEEETTD